MLSVLKENTAQIMEDRDVEEINYNAVRCAKCCYFYFLCEYVFLFMCEYVLFLLFLPFDTMGYETRNQASFYFF